MGLSRAISSFRCMHHIFTNQSRQRELFCCAACTTLCENDISARVIHMHVWIKSVTADVLVYCGALDFLGRVAQQWFE